MGVVCFQRFGPRIECICFLFFVCLFVCLLGGWLVGWFDDFFRCMFSGADRHAVAALETNNNRLALELDEVKRELDIKVRLWCDAGDGYKCL